MLVVVAALSSDAAVVSQQLRSQGADDIHQRVLDPHRVLLYGGSFDDRSAVQVVAHLRARGWPADVRPSGGGHLAAWRAHTRPVIIGGRLWVCFPWSEFDRSEAGDVIEIDPGQAFGSGSHPSTRLLLTALVDRLQEGESVLDVGCGSGVLSVAAARRGARTVTAIDVNPHAVAASAANAARNGVAGTIQAGTTPVDELIDYFDVILANMDAATLIMLAPAILARLAPGGWLGLSGVSPAQLSLVAAAYSPLRISASMLDDDWAALIVVSAIQPPAGSGPGPLGQDAPTVQSDQPVSPA